MIENNLFVDSPTLRDLHSYCLGKQYDDDTDMLENMLNNVEYDAKVSTFDENVARYWYNHSVHEVTKLRKELCSLLGDGRQKMLYELTKNMSSLMRYKGFGVHCPISMEYICEPFSDAALEVFCKQTSEYNADEYFSFMAVDFFDEDAPIQGQLDKLYDLIRMDFIRIAAVRCGEFPRLLHKHG